MIRLLQNVENKIYHNKAAAYRAKNVMNAVGILLPELLALLEPVNRDHSGFNYIIFDYKNIFSIYLTCSEKGKKKSRESRDATQKTLGPLVSPHLTLFTYCPFLLHSRDWSPRENWMRTNPWLDKSKPPARSKQQTNSTPTSYIHYMKCLIKSKNIKYTLTYMLKCCARIVPINLTCTLFTKYIFFSLRKEI